MPPSRTKNLTALLGLTLLSKLAFADITLWMIDISSHNSQLVIKKGLHLQDENNPIEMIFHRATIGTYAPPKHPGDSLFSQRAQEIHDASLYFGAYHVAYPSSDAASQAIGFVRAVQSACRPKQVVALAVDWEHVCVKWEEANRKKKCIKEGLVPPSFIIDFSDHIYHLTKIHPLIYTSPRALREFKDFFRENPAASERLARMKLWVARYRSRNGFQFPQPSDFHPWNDWTFWQFAEGKGLGPTRRISLRIQEQPIDTNFFNGPRSSIPSFLSEHSWACKE